MKLGRLPRNPKREVPLIPMKDMVVFPHTVIPFFVSQKKSLDALDYALKRERDIVVTLLKNDSESPGMDGLFTVGTLCHILQVLKLPDGKMRVLVEGRNRVEISGLNKKSEVLMAKIRDMDGKDAGNEEKLNLLMQNLKASFKIYASSKRKVPKEVLSHVEKADTPGKLIGHICTSLNLSPEQKAEYLQNGNVGEVLEELNTAIEMEKELLSLKKNIDSRVRKKMERTQKEYFLNEQLKEINKELGSGGEEGDGLKELENILLTKDLPQEVRTRAIKELKRLRKLQPMSPESGVLRTYLEWLSDLPWNNYSQDRKNLAETTAILDKDHYDLKKAKGRIIDFVAVRQMNTSSKSPILCFVGPPGTGKTSLGRSVARALDREFVRISLGGVRDEAEIRGHRKTYVGALPGKIIQSLRKANTSNPVFLLDEIDKMSNDFRGDPAAALLEVLDPEQNSTFGDHYLEVPYDLSHVMFITTANSLHNIPRPLLDRMEIIEISGYTDIEKYNIAREFIIPKQLKAHGLNGTEITFSEEALKKIISSYTMEAGVRNLDKQVAKVIRKILRQSIHNYQTKPGRFVLAMDEEEKIPTVLPRLEKEGIIRLEELRSEVSEEELKEYLGQPVFNESDLKNNPKPGLSIGLAWTEVGGRVLPVEVALLPGDGKLMLTGKLGDVMKESAQIALSYLRANSEEYGIDPQFHKDHDIHIHVPEGAIPKDGPSAGITMTSALLSALTGTPIRENTAMTGEITLTDRLLPIGGVKEKVLAAHRNGFSNVLLPADNRRDEEELPEEIKKIMSFHFFGSVKEALAYLFPGMKGIK
ncbi:MAG: endopeptidase La [Spirochaetales bacterium]|nr:endopeptidase La [Spirochaetales bacterium]